LHAEFPSVRTAFENHAAVLRDAGMSDADIAMMAKGRIPSGYQVHHVLPLDDGGTNATSNLVLIKNDPNHMLITLYQNKQTRGAWSDTEAGMADTVLAGACVARETGRWCLQHRALSRRASHVGYR
jgi:hypothetical protein